MRTPAVQRLLPLVVLVLSFTVFLPAPNGEFHDWDDHVNVVRNEGYRGLGWPQLRWAFSSTLMGHYIPLTWFTLGANYVAGEMNP